MARNALKIALLILAFAGRSLAGGPLLVTGRAFGNPGVPLVWPTSDPVMYRTPNAGGLGKLDNAHAVERVQQLFKVWEDVPTASIQIQNAGPIRPWGSYQSGAVDSGAKF